MTDDRNSIQQKTDFLSASLAVGTKPIFKEPHLIGDFVMWLEQNPNEGGRTTVFIRPWFQTDLSPQELTPAPINLRSRVHSYGGEPITFSIQNDQIHLVWINDCDGCLWSQYWLINHDFNIEKLDYLVKVNNPNCLSSKGDFCFAGGLIDVKRNRWLGIMEKNNKDYLVQFSLDKEYQEPLIIYEPKDFIGYLALSPNAEKLTWIEWQKPFMPWDASQLWLSNLDEFGGFLKCQLIAGQGVQDKKDVSVFQQVWISDEELVVSEDSSGWWNVMIANVDLNGGIFPDWHRCWPMQGESASPQWVFGMSTLAVIDEELVALICSEGVWKIFKLSKDGSKTLVKQPFTDLNGLAAKQGRIALIASSPSEEPGLLEIDLKSGDWKHSLPRKSIIQKESITVPKQIWFKGFQEKITHSWFYPPINNDCDPAPLLVKSHSGPTSMAKSGLNLEIQFWTSRGWAVLDVNYGGSSGFGRSYRERLKNNWGKSDIYDCAAAVKFLIAEGKVDKKMIAIEGSSASGFTTLGSLCFTDIYSVAACRYAVTDLISMIKSTHRFEQYYLDYLIGSFSEKYNIYKERSPINNANLISCPVIFFQGLKDNVVLPSQTIEMASALKKNNISVEIHTFAQEAHGFKDGKVKTSVLELTEKFFRKHLGI
tara:strand:+ start:2711 stop:4663 length:1953 start_codon:yes stop_codon:yes gene_type:complete